MMGIKNKSEDVWKRIYKRNENDCWEWEGYKDKDGYGTIHLEYKTRRVHRIVYELTYGSIPNRLYVLHKCDNPSCCNPNHLFIGTVQDNSDDQKRKRRTTVGDKHGRSKLTEKNILEIKRLYNTGDYYQSDLGKLFNISHQEISRIINNKRWRYLLMEE